jgi:hypothetical protein
MTLVDFLQERMEAWEAVFSQARTLRRAVALGFGIVCGLGKRTITRAICFHGNTQKDWSADYKVFSRSPWEPRELFAPILEHAIKEHKLKRLVFSADDTRVWRTGRHVPHTQWHRDPMGPPFQANLLWGHRFLQASLTLPLYKQDQESSSRSIPVRFEMAPALRKPGKNADEKARAEYKKERKEKNLSVQFVAMTRELRQHLNQSGHADKAMNMAVDGSFCNKTVFAPDWNEENVSITARCRKDIVLCKRAPGQGPRFYAKTKFTPERVRKRDSITPWKTAKIFHGGCYREVRYKELSHIHWQGGARKKPVRLLVVAPVELSHKQERAQVLPPARLSLEHGSHHSRRRAAAGLLRPLGH